MKPISPFLPAPAPRLARMAVLALLCATLLHLAPMARADEASALRAALARGAANDWPGAMAAAEGAVGRDIVEWQRLRAGEGLLGDYEAFLARRPDWPGLALLRQKGEMAVARSTTSERVIAYFGAGKPATGSGAMALVAGLAGLGPGQ